MRRITQMRQRHAVLIDKLLPTDNMQQALCACETLGSTVRYSIKHGLLIVQASGLYGHYFI